MSSLRRSTMSAMAPAGIPKRKTGRFVAVCTSATSRGDGANVAISHAAPTFCIQVPMLDTALAIQSHRNHLKNSGSQVPREAEDVTCVKPYSKVFDLGGSRLFPGSAHWKLRCALTLTPRLANGTYDPWTVDGFPFLIGLCLGACRVTA